MIAFYTVPFEVVKKRMQMGKIRTFEDGWLHTQPMYKNGAHALYTIFKYEGIKGLYCGFKCCILSETIFSAFQFLFYESFKNKYMSYTRREVTVYIYYILYILGKFYFSNGWNSWCFSFNNFKSF